MDQQLEKRLKEMTKEDFRDILKKLAIEIKTTDTDALEQEKRYELYKMELEKKFNETGIEISTVEDLKKLEEAGSLNEFKSEIAKHSADVLVTTTSNEAVDKKVDNTADMEKITDGLAELKSISKELQNLIDEFNKEKSTLSETAKKVKQNEIDEKKIAMEKKRKEIQDLIDKIKKSWKDMDLEAIDDVHLKEEIKKQRKEEEEKLRRRQKELDEIVTPGETVLKKTWNRVKKNPRGTTAIVGGGVLLIGWISGRFKKRKKKKIEESEAGEEKSSEKKGFRQTGFGKFLKRTGIGTGVYYLVHGFVTGRWNLKDFFNWNKKGADNLDTPEDQVSSYKERAEKNPEEKEKYESLGTNVDMYRNSIHQKEIDNGWEDDADMSTIYENVEAKGRNTIETTLKGVVPYCMDNSFSSVNSMLSEKGIEIDIFERDIAEIKTWLISRIKSALGKGLLGFLSVLPSYLKRGIGSTTEEKVENRLNSGKPEDRKKELKFFFRQQLRVTTYLNQKKDELKKKIAEDKLYVNNPKGFESVEEALNDEDRVKKEIETNQDYTSFMSGNILNAVTIMKKRNIFSAEIDKNIKEVVDETDEQRDEILDTKDGNDILERCTTDFEDDGKLEHANSIILAESCRKIINDITDEIEGPLEESMWNIYGDLRNSNDSNLRKILKESSLLESFKEIKQKLEDMILKIQNGTFTKDDLKSLKKFVNSYFAFKKELQIGGNTFEQIKDKNGDKVIRFGKFLWGCVLNMWEGLFGGHGFREGAGYVLTGGIPLFIVVKGVLYVVTKNGRKKLLKLAVSTPKLSKPILRTAKMINKRRYCGPASLIRKNFFDGATGPKNLEVAIRKGKISLDKAAEIADNGANGKFVSTTTKAYRSDFAAHKGDNIKNLLIQKSLNGKIGSWTADELRLVRENFDNKTRGKLLRESTEIDKNLILLKEYDTIDTSKKAFFNKILDKYTISKTDIEKLIKHANDIDISDIDDMDKAAKNLAKKISGVSTANDINKIIKNSNNAATNATNILKDEEVKNLTKMIDDEIKKMNRMIGPKGSPNRSDFRRAYYTESIQSLEALKNNVSLLKQADYNIIIKLNTYGLKVGDISKLYKLKTIQGLEEIENILEKGDIKELTAFLNKVSKGSKYSKYVVDIKALSSKLDVVGRKALNMGDDVADILKGMIRIFTKLT